MCVFEHARASRGFCCVPVPFLARAHVIFLRRLKRHPTACDQVCILHHRQPSTDSRLHFQNQLGRTSRPCVTPRMLTCTCVHGEKLAAITKASRQTTLRSVARFPPYLSFAHRLHSPAARTTRVESSSRRKESPQARALPLQRQLRCCRAASACRSISALLMMLLRAMAAPRITKGRRAGSRGSATPR